MKVAAVLFGIGCAAALSSSAPPVQAFEREWHLGAGAGVSHGNGLSLSPALAAYAAYGLSDAFDARVEVTARGYHVGRAENPNALSAMVGLGYKLDVLRWVPWAAVYAGYLTFLGEPRAELSFARRDVTLGVGLGLDYGLSRNWGAGVTLRFDDALTSSSARTFDALVRAEYRWGW